MKYGYLLLVVLVLTGCIIHPTTYRVYYLSGDSTSGQPPTDSHQYKGDDSVILLGPGTLQNNDYNFLGWGYKGTIYSVGDSITMRWEDINLYPVWDDGVDGPFLFKIEDGEAIITGYTQYYTSSITIPDTLLGKPVTAIGDSAFSDSSIPEVVLSEKLKRIGVGAFASNRIERLIIPSSVTTLGINAFRDNLLKKITFSESENGLTSIAPYAFSNNLLTNIILPDVITTIGEGAFYGSKIYQISIGAGVVIADDAALGVNGASFKALYDTEKLAGLYICADNNWKRFDRNIP